MYKEMISQYKVDYIAGGSGQNTMRTAQRVLQKPNGSIFMGCVGKDEFSQVMESMSDTNILKLNQQEPVLCYCLIMGQTVPCV